MRKLVSFTAFALGTVFLFNSASGQTATLQSTTTGTIRGNTSNLQRALNNRASLLDRANAQSSGQTQTQVDLSTRTSIDARANADLRINGNVNATARSNGNAANNRLLPSVGADRLTQGLIRRQSETDVLGSLRGRLRSDGETSHRTESQTRGHAEREQRSPEGPDILQTRAEVLAEMQARANTSPAERLLVKRLAQIDKMRDIALENGNERQLEQADHLEQLARWQFEHRFDARAANNPFAEISTETTLETEQTLHPFRMNRKPLPVLETETQTTVETETTTTVHQ